MVTVISAAGTYTILNEYTDFTVNYSATPQTLTLIPTGSGGQMSTFPVGQVKLEYYPLWVRGLTPNDFAITDDNPNGGFKIDMMTDEFPIVASPTGAMNFTLTAIPNDPIFEVNMVTVVNGVETSTPLYQAQGQFTVTGQVVTVPQSALNYIAPVIDGDECYVEILYTPFLTDSSLALGYHITRTDISKQITVTPCYFQTRV